MIDFRYHLVSLISVFLALAVGIALGAGPLKESIGDTLTGQVDQLRTEKDNLRLELDRSTGALANQEAALVAIAPDLVDGILPGRRVAVVQIGAVDAAVADGVVAQLIDAGATVSARVTVTDEWTDPARAAFRGTMASTLVGYLGPRPAANAGSAVELAEALVQALTTADPTKVDALSENSGVLLDLLSGDAGLITIDGPISTAADAVVVLAGPVVLDDAGASPDTVDPESIQSAEASAGTAVPDPEASTDQETTSERADAATQIARVAQARSTGVVVAGGATADPGVLHSLRSTSDVAAVVSTIDNVQLFAGQVSVPMALSARIAGTVGHYGTGDLATAVMPRRIVLPMLERIPPAQEPSGATTDAPPAAPEG